ncbi:MAG: hypothetical protein ACRBDX_03650 [Gammaproteobacteria bacterium]
MQTDSVKNICSGLMYKAKTEHFLDHSPHEIEKEANKFVEEFAKDNGLTAHTLSASRWYFQSDEYLLEDGFVELRCESNLFSRGGLCTFNVVDIGEIDNVKHLYEA